MRKYRRLSVAMVATCLTFGMVAAPSALAKSSTSSSPVAKAAVTTKALNSRINRTNKNLSKLSKNLGALSARMSKGEGGINLLLAAAPQLVTGLQTLAGAVQNQIAPGLKSLADAVQNQIAPNLTKLGDAVQNQIAPNLTKLGSAYSAVEYGRAGVFASGASTPTVAAGGTVTSADVPDDGNAIQAGDTAIVVAGATGAMSIDLTAAIRSAESDGDSTSKTVGQAGGFIYVVNADTGQRVACGGAPNPPGILGTTAGDSIVTPAGTVTNLPLKNLPGGVLRTDTTAPTSSSTSLLPAPCQFAVTTAGTTYEVHYSVNFLDIPTSTSPGPTE